MKTQPQVNQSRAWWAITQLCVAILLPLFVMTLAFAQALPMEGFVGIMIVGLGFGIFTALRAHDEIPKPAIVALLVFAAAAGGVGGQLAPEMELPSWFPDFLSVLRLGVVDGAVLALIIDAALVIVWSRLNSASDDSGGQVAHPAGPAQITRHDTIAAKLTAPQIGATPIDVTGSVKTHQDTMLLDAHGKVEDAKARQSEAEAEQTRADTERTKLFIESLLPEQRAAAFAKLPADQVAEVIAAGLGIKLPKKVEPPKAPPEKKKTSREAPSATATIDWGRGKSKKGD